MRQEQVEIYSDATNNAVIRHPGRRFPGLLLQGDTLHSVCCSLDQACNASRGIIDDDAFDELNCLRKNLWERLGHYKNVLRNHNIDLPFYDAD